MLDQALEIQPDNIDIITSKGDVLFALDREDEAIRFYDRVLEIEPDNEQALNKKQSVLDSMN